MFGPPDFFFADFVAGFSLHNFVGKSAQENPPGKAAAKSSKIYATKIPDTFLQRGWALSLYSVPLTSFACTHLERGGKSCMRASRCKGRAPLPAEWIFRCRFSLHVWILQAFCREFCCGFSVEFLSFVQREGRPQEIHRENSHKNSWHIHALRSEPKMCRK